MSGAVSTHDSCSRRAPRTLDALRSLALAGALLGATACGGSTQAASTGSTTPTAAGSKAAFIGGCNPAQSGEQLRVTDVNDDGFPEVCKYYREVDDPERPGQKKTVLLRQDLDVSWDGKIDIKRTFDASGLVVREEWDADYDGRVDEVRYFEDGKIVRSERDQDNDGQTDVTRFYVDGKLERKESDTNGDGKTDRWEYFKGRVVDRVGIDVDHDGKVDDWQKSPS